MFFSYYRLLPELPPTPVGKMVPIPTGEILCRWRWKQV